MKRVAIPKYFEMHKPILQCLADGGDHTLKELKSGVVKAFHLSEEDLAQLLPSGRQTYFANRVGWARTYLKKAGLIESPSKGVFCITPEGLRVLQEDPIVIDNAYLMRYDSFRAFTAPSIPDTTTPPQEDKDETPDDVLETAFNQINKSLAEDILAEVMKLSPTAFEKLVLDLMAKMGYGTFANAATLTATTGDEGIDGEKLAYYMIEHDFGVRTRKTFKIKAIDSDLFEDYQDV